MKQSKTPLEDSVPRLVGMPFLAYVCASEELAIERYLKEKTGLDERQGAVLQQVLDLAHRTLKRELELRTPATEVPFSSADALTQLCAYREAAEAGLATAWRRAAGGTVEDFDTGDEVLDALLTLARDFYPSLLIPHFEQAPPGRSTYSLAHSRLAFDHPSSKRFVRALTDSEPLRQIFPAGSIDELTTSKQLMARSGLGGGTQGGLLAILLLANAEPRAIAAGELTLQSYLDFVTEELGVARQLAAGEEVNVRAAVGLQGTALPKGFHFETPWGHLREPSTWEQRWAPLGADLVFETLFPMSIEARDQGPGGEMAAPNSDFFNPQRRLIDTVDHLRLAFVLASSPEAPIALNATWRYIPDPFQIPSFSWGLQPPRARGSRPISKAELPEIERWMELVAERYDPKLDLPTRRLLGALTDRPLGEDGLLDATIALESLFGTGQGEIRFRLAAAVAWLLGSTLEERTERQRLAGKLYDQRSRVVHGSHLNPADAEVARGAAIRLTIESMRALISDRPELIADEERGRKLVLGGANEDPGAGEDINQ
jgi:Apea-like HEPN